MCCSFPGVLLTLCLLVAACDGDNKVVTDASLAPDASTMIDAAPEPGVRCGPAQTYCDPTTTLGCCENPPAAPACQPLEPPACAGTLTSCDGLEDCVVDGDACCKLGSAGASCIPRGDCTSSGGTVLCHFDGDCAGLSPNCCAGVCTSDVCI